MNSDETVFYAIATEPPPAAAGQNRRRSFRRPLGTVATIARLLGGETLNRLQVLIVDVSNEGVGLRSPIGLIRDGVYRLQIGHADATDSLESLIRVVTSRSRPNGTFDVGARYI
jgi:hypothetical protein